MNRARHWLPRLAAAWWIGAAGLIAGTTGGAELPPSPAPHYVLDEAGWLGPEAFSSLDASLEAYEKESSSQLVVAIFRAVPAGGEMVDFCQRVFEAWRPGLKGRDNGAVLFIFANDRKLRIHTGYGMEGVLPDARCKQIIEEVITPRLREGQRESAVRDGVRAIIAATRGEYQGTGRTHGSQQDHGSPPGRIPWALVLFLIVFLLVVVFGKAEDRGIVIISGGGSRHGSWGGGWSSGGGGGGGFSGGGGSSGGGGASGSW